MSEPVEAGTASVAAPQLRKKDHGSALWREIKGMSLVILAVLAFHSFIAVILGPRGPHRDMAAWTCHNNTITQVAVHDLPRQPRHR